MAPNKKMGRPTDDPKTLSFRVRISKEDNEMLQFCAEKTGLTKAEIIRKGIKKIYSEIKK